VTIRRLLIAVAGVTYRATVLRFTFRTGVEKTMVFKFFVLFFNGFYGF